MAVTAGAGPGQLPTRVPQPAQKCALAGSSVPHSVQCWTAGASAWPQPMQNFAPAGFCAWQDAHTGPDEACWGGAPWGPPGPWP